MESSRWGVGISDSFWELTIELNKWVGSRGFSNRHMKNLRLQWRFWGSPTRSLTGGWDPVLLQTVARSDAFVTDIYPWIPRIELLPFRYRILPTCCGPTDVQDVVPFTYTTDWLQPPVQWHWRSKTFLCKASKCQQGTGFVAARKTKLLEDPEHQNVGFQVVEGWGAPHPGDG